MRFRLRLGSMQVQPAGSVRPRGRLRVVVAALVAAFVGLAVMLVPMAGSASASTSPSMVTLFYRAGDGAAVTGAVDQGSGGFTSQQGVGPFGTGWTQIVSVGNG